MNGNDVNKRDQERREAVRRLLAEGKVQSAKDYRFAALILQHSTDSAGYLLAHTLAVTSVGKGMLRRNGWPLRASIAIYNR